MVGDGEHGVIVGCPDVDDGQLTINRCIVAAPLVNTASGATSMDGTSELIGDHITRIGWGRRPEE